MSKKLSPAQQKAVEIIGQNPVVVDRFRRGGSVLIKYASRKYAPTGIKISTIEALIRSELVTVHPADQDGDQAIKLLTTPEAPEAPETAQPQTKKNIMAAKKLSQAQETLLNLLQGRTLTYRIKAKTGIRSMLEVKVDGKNPIEKIKLATIEALIDRGLVIVKSVDKDNMYTVILPCDNHATVPAQGETFAVLQKENAALKAERKEIEKRHRTVGYTVDSDRRLTVIDRERWELYRKAAYILMTTAAVEIEDAKFAHHVVDIAALTSQSQAERDFWDDQKAWWGKEIKRRREAPKATEAKAAPEAPPAHRDAALSQDAADAIEQRHNVIVDRGSEMYTDNHPCSTNDYGATGWKLIPQEWIDEFTTHS